MHEYSNYIDRVVVIESLRPSDTKTGEQLYRAVIRPEGAKRGLRASFETVRAKSEFFEHLRILTDDCRANHHSPILHIECHGSADGLEIGGEFVGWREIKPYLMDLNVVSELNLLVCLAACSGANLVKVLSPIDRAPVWGLVGPKRRRTDRQLLRDYSAFYRLFISTQDGRAALEKLNHGPPSPAWAYAFAPAEWFFKRIYAEYLKVHASAAALGEREERIIAKVQVARRYSASELAKVRADIRRRLADQEPFFQNFYRRFFMTDLLPGNALRFPIAFSDVQS